MNAVGISGFDESSTASEATMARGHVSEHTPCCESCGAGSGSCQSSPDGMASAAGQGAKTLALTGFMEMFGNGYSVATASQPYDISYVNFPAPTWRPY
jgi:hypothetical protein